MELLSTYAVRLVLIAAASSVCEHFLSSGRAEKGMGMLTGLAVVWVLTDALAALLGR